MKTLKLLIALGIFLTLSSISAAAGAGGDKPHPDEVEEMLEKMDNFQERYKAVSEKHSEDLDEVNEQRRLEVGHIKNIFDDLRRNAELAAAAAPLLALSDADIEARFNIDAAMHLLKFQPHIDVEMEPSTEKRALAKAINDMESERLSCIRVILDKAKKNGTPLAEAISASLEKLHPLIKETHKLRANYEKNMGLQEMIQDCFIAYLLPAVALPPQVISFFAERKLFHLFVKYTRMIHEKMIQREDIKDDFFLNYVVPFQKEFGDVSIAIYEKALAEAFK